MTLAHGPWIDVHAHPGQCFFVDLDTPHPLSLWPEGIDPAAGLRAAREAGMAAVAFGTVADLAVLAMSRERGMHAGRAFVPGEAHADHERQLQGLVRMLDAEGTAVARTASDLERAHASGTTAALLTCEGGDFIEGDLDRLVTAQAAGVSSLTLVHYRVNDLGDIQTEPPVHHGLTAAGRDVVALCNELGVVIDCAHATVATTMGVLEASSAPVMISHSHLDHTDRSHPRLLSDAHARAVTDAGGVIGVWPSGVTSATFEDFVDEIVRLVELVGVDHVGIGTDLDGCYKPVVTAYSQFAAIAEALGERGMAATEVDTVLGGSALELWRTVAG